MGNWPSSLQTSLRDLLTTAFASRKTSIVVVGLDGAGKTTLMHKIKLGVLLDTTYTPGLDVEAFQFIKTMFTSWDTRPLSGIRSLWCYFLRDCDGVIFVVDSADHNRVDEAKQALTFIFEQEGLSCTKLLVFANKQDHPDALSAEELREKLELSEVTSNPTHVQSCVATTGEGVYVGLEWLSEAIKIGQDARAKTVQLRPYDWLNR